MIEIKGITKIYRSKKKSKHKALDNINVTLPNNGLVFVIGKSGSGKSTLLNLIGGLDSTTSGNIIVDGNDITTYKEKQLANYRSSHIGFIFQDYHLLEELTVYQNIRMSMDLICQEDDGKIADALSKVGLSGYENRYPSELSGGEQQRVAIARAIVKNPRLILADEPTGNLDNVTSTGIIKLLKQLAKDCLILIVSHNTIDTYTYADRIIQLANGQIVQDISRNPDFSDQLAFDDNQMVYPCDKVLDDTDISNINQKLQNDSLKKVVLASNKYVPTVVDPNKKSTTVPIKKVSPAPKRVMGLSGTFLKTKLPRIAIYSFIVAVIIVVLSFSQTIIAFDSSKVIEDEMHQGHQESLYVRKLNADINIFYDYEQYYERLDAGIVTNFQQNNPDAAVYPVFNTAVPITGSYGIQGIKRAALSKAKFNETFGTILVDEQFFISRLGSLQYVAKLENPDPRGVFITDFVADQILANVSRYRNKTPQDILGGYSIDNYGDRVYINGIIQTDYLVKYQELLQQLASSKAEALTALQEADEYLTFLDELYDYLGFSFTFNPDFLQANKSEPLNGIAWTQNIAFEIAGETIPSNFTTTNRMAYHEDNPALKLNYDLAANEVTMNYARYNEIFRTSWTTSTMKDFVPHEITISQYNFYDYELKYPLQTMTIKIVKLHSANATFVASDEVYRAFSQQAHFVQGIYFEKMDHISSIIDQCNEKQMTFESHLVDGIKTMSRAVEVFVDIFALVGAVLCIGVVFLLISFASKMIKDKYHDIGILKALGCKNVTISTIFGLQLALIALCTMVMSVLGYGLFIGVANDVLVGSLQVLAPGRIVLDLDFLTFIPTIALSNCVLVLILSLLAFVFPMLKIYKINPVQIIKTRE